MKNNCAFQYATPRRVIFNETGITLEEAKKLYNENFIDCAVRIQNGECPEMAIWVDMPDEETFSKKLVHIDGNNEAVKSNGSQIWIDKRIYFEEKL